jgi:hypothetical protein
VCAGKTHLAQRLAQQYGLLHVNTAAVLAELPLMDAETQKVGGPPTLHCCLSASRQETTTQKPGKPAMPTRFIALFQTGRAACACLLQVQACKFAA